MVNSIFCILTQFCVLCKPFVDFSWFESSQHSMPNHCRIRQLFLPEGSVTDNTSQTDCDILGEGCRLRLLQEHPQVDGKSLSPSWMMSSTSGAIPPLPYRHLILVGFGSHSKITQDSHMCFLWLSAMHRHTTSTGVEYSKNG